MISMKKLFKTLLVSIFSLNLLFCNIYGQEIYTEGTLEYQIESDGSITIVGYFGSDEIVYIPSSIAGHPVNTIGSGAFDGSSALVVYVPDSVISIQEGALGTCKLGDDYSNNKDEEDKKEDEEKLIEEIVEQKEAEIKETEVKEETKKTDTDTNKSTDIVTEEIESEEVEVSIDELIEMEEVVEEETIKESKTSSKLYILIALAAICAILLIVILVRLIKSIKKNND